MTAELEERLLHIVLQNGVGVVVVDADKQRIEELILVEELGLYRAVANCGSSAEAVRGHYELTVRVGEGVLALVYDRPVGARLSSLSVNC